MRADQDTTMVAGDRLDLRYTVTDEVTGVVVDLTGASSVQWKASKKIIRSDGTDTFSSTPVVSKSTGSGVVVTPLTGLVVVSLLAADTKDLTPGDYHSELEITLFNSSGPYTVAQGTLTILKGLIR